MSGVSPAVFPIHAQSYPLTTRNACLQARSMYRAARPYRETVEDAHTTTANAPARLTAATATAAAAARAGSKLAHRANIAAAAAAIRGDIPETRVHPTQYVSVS